MHKGVEQEPESSRRLGRYLLFESLGAGGMGEVYRAKAFGAAGVVKDLCIKRIRASKLSNPAAVERFVEEARVSMRLSHSGIVSVFDFGRCDDEYYLAMEWVDGGELRQILSLLRSEGDVMPPGVAAHVTAQVARALSYAHGLQDERGVRIVHRDVKPANVLVSRSGEVKLSDFGIAAIAGAEARGLAGTRGYMPPEQERGEAPDPRSDLFALGVVLHELLTCRLPREGVSSDANEELVPLLESLLAERPEGRPPDAHVVADELEAFAARQRAAGGVSPQRYLSEVVARLPRKPNAGDPTEMGASVSFVTEGLSPTFVSRMTFTTEAATAPVTSQGRLSGREIGGGSAAGTEGESRSGGELGVGRRVARWAVGLAVLAVLAVGAFFVGAGKPLAGGSVSVPATPTDDGRSGGQEAPPAVGLLDEGGDVRVERTVDEPPPPRPATRKRRSHPASAAAASAASASAPEEKATININAVPWAEVFVDGARAGVTPLFSLELTPGTHQLRLVNGPLEIERHVPLELKAGTHRNLVIELEGAH